MQLDGASRAEFLLRRLHAKGPLTESGIAWLQVLLPLDPTERYAYIHVIRQAAAEDGIDTPWSDEDSLPEAAKALFVRQHIVWRAMDGPAKVPYEPDAAYADFQAFRAEQAAPGVDVPALCEATYTTLFEEMRPLDERARLQPPAPDLCYNRRPR